ncbi:MAG: MotE family protein [Acetobacteraceae bacterium]
MKAAVPRLSVTPPRLLPMTIALTGGLLAMKTVALVRGALQPSDLASPAMIMANAHASAAASSHGAPAAKPAAQAEAPPPETPAVPEEPKISEGEKAVLLELRQRRQELDARESAVAARESVLAAAEQKLSARIEELQALQKRLEGLEAARQQRDDTSWQGLVRLYESMKPRDAATIFNELQMPVLLQVLDRMKDTKAAGVLAAMNPDKARDVTAALAKLRTHREQPPDPGAPAPSAGRPPPGTPKGS